MKEKDRILTEEERKLIEEAERYMEEVNQNPEVCDAMPPAEAYEELLQKIRNQEAEHAAEKETAELIRLGMVYKKRRKMRKYFVLAAALVLALALGITSIGGPERIAKLFRIEKLGRDQAQMNSGEDVDVVEHISEEEVWQKIEDEYGFYPVKFRYMPKDTKFLEVRFSKVTQTIQVYYEGPSTAMIVVRIYTGYGENSAGIDVEEETVSERYCTIDDNEVIVKQYRVEETDEHRWGVEFASKGIKYSVLITGVEETEIEKIVKNLRFL